MMKSGAMQAWPLLQPHLPAAILFAVTLVETNKKKLQRYEKCETSNKRWLG
jgi:hypothetical protein